MLSKQVLKVKNDQKQVLLHGKRIKMRESIKLWWREKIEDGNVVKRR